MWLHLGLGPPVGGARGLMTSLARLARLGAGFDRFTLRWFKQIRRKDEVSQGTSLEPEGAFILLNFLAVLVFYDC